MRARPLAFALAALLAAPATAPAFAQVVTGDAVAGGTMARTWCANCHVVGPGQAATPATGDAAPTFASVVARPETTALSLSVFLQTPHHRMPDYSLSRNEIADLVAYILSLRGR
jgi:mono/diheme cytochrome c family protein